MKKAALYVRVSTDEQKLHGLSVDSQIEALEEYCKSNKLTVFKIYNDAGFSASKSYKKRPALTSLLTDSRQGMFDVVLFTRLDRWFRSVPDYYAVQGVLDENHIPWRAIWEDYETETSSGVFKVNIMLSVAQAEAQRTSEKIKSVLEFQKARGDYVGSAPTGYKVENHQLVKDAEKENLIKSIFDNYLKSFSYEKTFDAVHCAGDQLSISTIREVLKNPAYYGECRNGYHCEPYITKEQFDFIQEQKKKYIRKPKTDKAEFIFSGLCYCGYCGKRMRGHSNLTRAGKKQMHQICNYTGSNGEHRFGVSIAENKLEKYLLNQLEPLLDGYKVEIETRRRSYRPEQKTVLHGKLERLKELYIEGDLDKSEYLLRKENIESDLLQLANAEEPKQAPELPEDWRSIYEKLDREHRRVFWRSIISKIVITRENKENPDVYFR